MVEALRRGDAEASRVAFEAALAQGETGEALDGLTRARHLAADYKESIDAHERAFTAYRRIPGDPRQDASRSLRLPRLFR